MYKLFSSILVINVTKKFSQSKNFIRANKIKFLNSPQKKDHGDGPAESKSTYSKPQEAQDVADDDSDIPF